MNTATLLGSVSDASGAAVPDTAFRIVSESTSFVKETTSDPEGKYQLLQIPAGKYRIEFEKPGFQREVQTGMEISAGQSLGVNETLSVGSLSETVRVDRRRLEPGAATGLRIEYVGTVLVQRRAAEFE